MKAFFARFEIRTLAALMTVAAAIWAFLTIGGEVGESETLPTDRQLLLLLRTPGHPADPIGPHWFEESMRDVTALGGFTVLTLLTVVAASVLLFYGKAKQAVVFVGTVLAAEISSDLLKLVYDRARPDLVPHGSYVYSHSFPSGHSTVSAAAYLTLVSVIASLDPHRHAKAFLFAIAGLVVLSIGFSRVYLGVHWPSDVLAGWALGAAWALAARLVLGWWLRRGA
ncbi:undecaprenyl-diphosphatase [Caulobacter ginsengisoli]|uniref:Undecaprenyl-diphosphatase n=1 Tax=Caulobacter ginsengisoli TaxID=400775 RepID=A0ABU0IM38_9CAUL|nr:phosphatase PAP2 family protein [Caulobacter ginsengisoli]MDQ0463072.1 undecaprenyl-diphosphatase [Caulobacter ginsengisoli]